MPAVSNLCPAKSPVVVEEIIIVEEFIDLEEYAKKKKHPVRAKRYRIPNRQRVF